jgi:hypothetical protein
MPNSSYTQQALAADANFTMRVRAAIATVAWQVLTEDPSTPDHDVRASFARQVIRDVNYAAVSVSPWLVERPNLVAFDTTFDFVAGHVVTASGDSDIESQIHTDWDILAGVSTTPPPPPPPVVPGVLP